MSFDNYDIVRPDGHSFVRSEQETKEKKARDKNRKFNRSLHITVPSQSIIKRKMEHARFLSVRAGAEKAIKRTLTKRRLSME